MYLIKQCRAGQTIDVQKVYTIRQYQSLKRKAKRNGLRTPEAMRRYNQTMAERELARLINANFQTGDLHLVLTYRRGQRPDEEKANRDLDNFIRRLRKYYRSRGVEFKYIAAIGYGERGALHHHLVIPRMDVLDLPRLWPGGFRYTPLYQHPDYTALAVYIARQNRSAPDDSGKTVRRRRWSASKNLIRPKPEVKEVDCKTWREPPAPAKGYVIAPESIDAGINPITGIPYLFYRMVRIPDGTVAVTPDGIRLRGEKARVYLQKQNREYIRKEWNPHERRIQNTAAGGNDNEESSGTEKTNRKRRTAMSDSMGPFFAGGAS